MRGRPPAKTTVPSFITVTLGSTLKGPFASVGAVHVLASSLLQLCPYGTLSCGTPLPMRNRHINRPSLRRQIALSDGPSSPFNGQFSSAMVARFCHRMPSEDSATAREYFFVL